MPTHLLLWVSEGEAADGQGSSCPLPPRGVPIAHGLLGEEGLGDRGGELEALAWASCERGVSVLAVL